MNCDDDNRLTGINGNTVLRQELDALTRRFFGKKSERLNAAQLAASHQIKAGPASLQLETGQTALRACARSPSSWAYGRSHSRRPG
jgi:hypothetical protein